MICSIWHGAMMKEQGNSSANDSYLNTYILCAILIVITIFVYAPAVLGSWYFDDYHSIVANKSIRSLSQIPNILDNFIHRGIVNITYTIDYSISDYLDLASKKTPSGATVQQYPYVYKVSNIFFHLIAVIGVYLLCLKLLPLLSTNSLEFNNNDKLTRSFSAYVALIFAIHPLNTEAVSYISGRSSALATIEYLYGMLFFISAMEDTSIFKCTYTSLPSQMPKKAIFKFICGALLFVLGIGTKEIIITLPAMAIVIAGFVIYNSFGFSTMFRRLMPFLMLFCGLIILFVLYRIINLGGIIGINEAIGRPRTVNMMTEIGVIVFYYLPREFFIGKLCIDPVAPLILSIFEPSFIFAFIIICTVFAIGIYTYKKMPIILLGIIWYFVTISPTSSFIPLNDLVAERRTYLPNFGFSLSFAGISFMLIYLLSKKARWLALLATGIVIIMLICAAKKTVDRNVLYLDKTKFWEDTLACAPDNPRVLANLGSRYENIGQYKKAESMYLKSLKINVDNPNVYNNLGILYLKQFKQYKKAAKHFLQMINIWPENIEAWTNLGTSLLLMNETEKAKELAAAWYSKGPKT